nr:MAG TPA: restriction alleviation protein [Caudoviricetes sp.]
METKLRVCPFCGCKAEFLEAEYDFPIAIHCIGCGATMHDNLDNGKEELVNQWNEREILDEAIDANDDQIYTEQERADILIELIEKYNRYED